MQLTFTTDAITRLERYLAPSKKILLDFDDGVGPLSKVGTCSLDGGYRLIFVPQTLDLPDYNYRLDSNLGDVFIKDYSKVQFDDQMEVRFNPNYFTLPLVSRQRILTDNLEVLDLSDADLASPAGNTHDC